MQNTDNDTSAQAQPLKIWAVALAHGHLDAVRVLADEAEIVGFGHATFETVPLGAEVLIDSSAAGWMVAVCRWSGLHGSTQDLASLCLSLASTGRKRDLEIAGRIKARALRKGAPAKSWAGEPPKRRPHKPRGMVDVAKAWSAGTAMKAGNVRTDGIKIFSWNLCIGKTIAGEKVAIDYRGGVSSSTSHHCGVVIGNADRVEGPP